jgi:CheY-like chemotaxis protein
VEGGRQLALPSPVSIDLGGISIVAVDDDADTRELLKRLLDQCKAVITVVENAEEALQAVEQMKPQVILCDLEAPWLVSRAIFVWSAAPLCTLTYIFCQLKGAKQKECRQRQSQAKLND